MNRKFFIQNNIRDLPVDGQIESMQSCTIVTIMADTYTAVAGSTITLALMINPPGIYSANIKVNGATVGTTSITTDSSGVATIPLDTTGRSPGLYNLAIEIIGPSPMSCSSMVLTIALTTAGAACTGITINTPGPITVYEGGTASISVTASGVTEPSMIELRETTIGQGLMLCPVSPPGGQCTVNVDVPVGTPSGIYNMVAAIGSGTSQRCVSSPIEIIILSTSPCTSITTPIATPSIAAIGDTVTLVATAYPTTSVFNVTFKDQNNNVLGSAYTMNGVATLSWNTAGKTAGTYNIRAYVGTQCVSSTAAPVTLSVPGVCTMAMTEADTYTAVVGSTITLITIVNPPGIYDVGLKVDGTTVSTTSITTSSSGVATLPWDTTGRSPGLYDLALEITGPSPMSCNSPVGTVALTTVGATCTGITIDTPGPIVAYEGGGTLSISVTSTGVTEQSVIEFRDTASGYGGMLCTVSPPGGQCTISMSVPAGTPSGIYNMVVSIGNGSSQLCVSDPVELIILSILPCTSITIPTATPSTVIIGDTVILAATVQPSASIFGVVFKDQNNNVLGQSYTVDGVATLQWNTTGKVHGIYNIRAYVGTQCSSPAIQVTVNLPPCISITAPNAAPSTVTIGGTVTLTATAQPSTSIFNVAFKDQNNNLLGTANTVNGVATLRWNTTGKAAGTYDINTHVGTQCSSLTTVPVTLAIQTADCISVTTPIATPSTVTIGEVVTLSVTAEPTTDIFTVDFRDQDYNVLGSENTSSGIASYVWNTGGVIAGTYNIKAYVGTQCISSDPVLVTVNQTTVVCTSITTPLAIPSSAIVGELVALRATVQPSTSIYTVDFKDQDNNVIGSANTVDGDAAYNWNTTNKTAGIYQISAHAGTCDSSSSVAVTLSAAAEAGGGGMVIGLVGIAALGMMMYRPKP